MTADLTVGSPKLDPDSASVGPGGYIANAVFLLEATPNPGEERKLEEKMGPPLRHADVPVGSRNPRPGSGPMRGASASNQTRLGPHNPEA